MSNEIRTLEAECERLRNQVRGNEIDYGLICKERDAALAELAALKGEQVAVGVSYTMEAMAPGGSVKSHASLNRDLPAGTKLYAHPADQVAGHAQHARDSAELRRLCAARDQYRELSIKYGDKLGEVFKLLAKCQEHLDPHRDAVLWGEVCDALKVKP